MDRRKQKSIAKKIVAYLPETAYFYRAGAVLFILVLLRFLVGFTFPARLFVIIFSGWDLDAEQLPYGVLVVFTGVLMAVLELVTLVNKVVNKVYTYCFYHFGMGILHAFLIAGFYHFVFKCSGF